MCLDPVCIECELDDSCHLAPEEIEHHVWLGVWVDPLHLLASARTHNSISAAITTLRLVAVRSAAMRAQREQLAGIMALPLEMLQEIESWLFDVAYIDFHPGRSIMIDHDLQGTISACTPYSKKGAGKARTHVRDNPYPEEWHDDSCSRRSLCTLCAARKAQGLHGISSELIEAHCDAEQTAKGMLCPLDDCSDRACGSSEMRECMRHQYVHDLVSHRTKEGKKEVQKALRTWGLDLASAPRTSYYCDAEEPVSQFYFGRSQLQAWGVGISLQQGDEVTQESGCAYTETGFLELDISLTQQQAVAAACDAMARDLRLRPRSSNQGSDPSESFPLFVPDSHRRELTLTSPPETTGKKGKKDKKAQKAAPRPVRASLHLESTRVKPECW